MRSLTKIEADQLEAMINAVSLAEVVEATAQICRLKAVHISDNWQDAGLARVWLRAAVAIEKASESKAVKAVP